MFLDWPCIAPLRFVLEVERPKFKVKDAEMPTSFSKRKSAQIVRFRPLLCKNGGWPKNETTFGLLTSLKCQNRFKEYRHCGKKLARLQVTWRHSTTWCQRNGRRLLTTGYDGHTLLITAHAVDNSCDLMPKSNRRPILLFEHIFI